MRQVPRHRSFWVKACIVGGLVAACVAVTIPLLTSGADTESERRAAVNEYLAEVNTTQQDLVRELERVSVAYRKLELTSEPPPGQLDAIVEAERSLRRLRGRFARLRPPPEARSLHAQLLRLGDLQIAFAREVTEMVRYLPRQAAEARRLAAETGLLRRGLEDADTGETQSAVFVHYRERIRASAGRLARSSVPPVLEPARQAEIARLTRLAALAGQLSRALEDQRATEVDRLLKDFVRSSASAGTTRAEREAIIAFNRRLARIGEASAAVEAEHRKLSVELP